MFRLLLYMSEDEDNSKLNSKQGKYLFLVSRSMYYAYGKLYNTGSKHYLMCAKKTVIKTRNIFCSLKLRTCFLQLLYRVKQ